MDRYTKWFVLASLVYFFIAAALGIWMGTAGTPEWVSFVHVHFNLLGFMSMMIYGVGYFILPRFNARALKWPAWVGAHFYLANIGLIGMAITAPLRPATAFAFFSLLSVLSVAMFALNLGATLLGSPQRQEEQAAKAEPPRPKIYITPDSKMGDIVSQWPHTIDVLIGNGLAPLRDPAHLEKVKQLPVTLGMACERHGIDCERMVALLNKAVGSSEQEAAGAAPRSPPASVRGKLEAGQPIRPHHVIGDILNTYPATEKVFRKYYGAACFSCPGQATESIRQSAMMHNVDEQEILADLNIAAGL